jgi:hypothetical protein
VKKQPWTSINDDKAALYPLIKQAKVKSAHYLSSLAVFIYLNHSIYCFYLSFMNAYILGMSHGCHADVINAGHTTDLSTGLSTASVDTG